MGEELDTLRYMLMPAPKMEIDYMFSIGSPRNLDEIFLGIDIGMAERRASLFFST
jgi:hypothetical protein